MMREPTLTFELFPAYRENQTLRVGETKVHRQFTLLKVVFKFQSILRRKNRFFFLLKEPDRKSVFKSKIER